MRDEPPDYPEPLENCAQCDAKLDPEGEKDDGFFCSTLCSYNYQVRMAEQDDAACREMQEQQERGEEYRRLLMRKEGGFIDPA